MNINNILLKLTIIIAGLWCVSCEKEPIFISDPQVEIPFEGTWTRQFYAGPDNLHDAAYYIYQDSVRYILTGPIGNANYVILRDTFLLEENRYIGHTKDGVIYTIFVKQDTSEKLSLYKQQVEDTAEGLLLEVPHASTTLNHGWGEFTKQ